MTAAAPFAGGGAASGRTVPLRGLAALFVALLVFDNMLLLAFLGQPLVPVVLLGVGMPTAFAVLTYRAIPAGVEIGVRTLAICLAVAAVLLILGGEGRLFYATADWQIRDAVLADMGGHRWPFDYWLDGRAQMLRAPIGMYLLPALLGGVSQMARDWALAVQNILILGLLFSMAAALFDTARSRAIALVVFLSFSGLDVIGTALAQWTAGQADWDHLERWAVRLQYSSHITQIFWVPQHAFAGWACALAYLLWRRGLIPIGLFGAIVPLVALWSPFALFGVLPFAFFAGVSVLLSGKWGWKDVALCALALAAALPSLLYLSSNAQSVGGGVMLPSPILYLLLMMIDVVPFMVPLLRDRAAASDRATLWIVLACLLLMPLYSIGPNNDFQMRASIVPLALAAVAFGQWAARIESRGAKTAFLLIVTLGAMTGAAEIARAIRLDPSPPPLCSLPQSWTQQSGMIVPYNSYFAPIDRLPRGLAPAKAVERAPSNPQERCWARPWRSDGKA